MDETLLHTEPLGQGQIVTQNFDYVLDIPCVNLQNQPAVEVTFCVNLAFWNFCQTSLQGIPERNEQVL